MRLIHGDAKTVLASMPTKSVSLILSSPPVTIYTDKGKTTNVLFDTEWIEEAERVADCVIFTLHGDVLASLWAKDAIQSFSKPERIGVWAIGEEGRFGITAQSANLILAYGHHPGLRSLPDVIVASPGDHHWPPSEFHPCPGSFYLAYHIVSHMKPRVLLDPFLGSGVILHAGLVHGCEELIGIDLDQKWVEMVGQEIDSRGIPLG